MSVLPVVDDATHCLSVCCASSRFLSYLHCICLWLDVVFSCRVLSYLILSWLDLSCLRLNLSLSLVFVLPLSSVFVVVFLLLSAFVLSGPALSRCHFFQRYFFIRHYVLFLSLSTVSSCLVLSCLVLLSLDRIETNVDCPPFSLDVISSFFAPLQRS